MSREIEFKDRVRATSANPNEIDQLLVLLDELEDGSIDRDLVQISLLLKCAINRLEYEKPKLELGLWFSFIAKDYYDELCRTADCEDGDELE